MTVSQAPAVNVAVALSSNDTSEFTVPATVTILAGQTSATFNVTVVDDTLIDGPQTATVTAHVQNWTDGSAALDVLDNDGWLDAAVADRGLGGCRNGQRHRRVTLGGTLGADLVVTLPRPTCSELQVPATVTIPAGQTTATFILTVVNDADRDGTQTVTVTAAAAGLPGDSEPCTIHGRRAAPFRVGHDRQPADGRRGVHGDARGAERGQREDRAVHGDGGLERRRHGGAVPVTPATTGPLPGALGAARSRCPPWPRAWC